MLRLYSVLTDLRMAESFIEQRIWLPASGTEKATVGPVEDLFVDD